MFSSTDEARLSYARVSVGAVRDGEVRSAMKDIGDLLGPRWWASG
jgi:hypothetical protein